MLLFEIAVVICNNVNTGDDNGPTIKAPEVNVDVTYRVEKPIYQNTFWTRVSNLAKPII
jgi:hypothetical protein